MRILLFITLMAISVGVFGQQNLLNVEIGLSTAVPAVNYERFIAKQFSMGAKLGIVAAGIKANYYF